MTENGLPDLAVCDNLLRDGTVHQHHLFSPGECQPSNRSYPDDSSKIAFALSRDVVLKRLLIIVYSSVSKLKVPVHMLLPQSPHQLIRRRFVMHATLVSA